MIICRNCNQENGDYAVFCTNCGASIIETNNQVNPNFDNNGQTVSPEVDITQNDNGYIPNSGFQDAPNQSQDYSQNGNGYIPNSGFQEAPNQQSQDYSQNGNGYIPNSGFQEAPNQNQGYSQNQNYNQGYNQNYSQNQQYGQNNGGYNNYNQGYTPPVQDNRKSKLAAGLLAFFLGSLGIHNFYLGYSTKGIIQLLVTIIGGTITCGIGVIGVQIWAIVEAVMIFTDSNYRDANGNTLKD